MKRRPDLDLIKITGMLLVVMGHAYSPWAFEKLIYSFHMPVFLFISGMLYRHKDLYSGVKSRAKGLLLPYCLVSIGSIVFLMIYAPESVSSFKSLLNGFFLAQNEGMVWNSPLWYLPALFSAMLILSCFHCLPLSSAVVAVLAMLLAYIISSLALERDYLYFALDTAIPCLFFISAGYLFAQMDRQIKMSRAGIYAVAIAVTALFVGLRFYSSHDYYVLAKLRIDSYPLFFATGLAGSLSCIYVVRILADIGVLKWFSVQYLSLASAYSFALYLLHKPFINFIRYYYPLDNSWYAVLVYGMGSISLSVIAFVLIRGISARFAALMLGGRLPKMGG